VPKIHRDFAMFLIHIGFVSKKLWSQRVLRVAISSIRKMVVSPLGARHTPLPEKKPVLLCEVRHRHRPFVIEFHGSPRSIG